MRKIYIDKSDSVAAVTEKILQIHDDDIVIYIPRFTKLISSAQNFRLLKREIDSSGKNVQIESVDDEVLDLAKAVGIPASNPFFRKNKRPMSDILLPQERGHSDVIETGGDIVEEEASEVRIDEVELESEQESENKKGEHTTWRERARFRFEKPGFSFNFKNPVKVFFSALIGVTLLMGGAVILPSANIKVKLNEKSWDFSGSILASASIKEPSFSNGQVRVGGVVIEKTKNVTSSYPASGTENVSRKASGTITVYNAYSSEPQPIVANTRFSSPDGKIFRITRGVTIPGAKIVNNKIVPSTIDLVVVADQPGADYNIGPTTFRIPGFQGSPKYEGFYGESQSSMSGGFVGVRKVATDADIIKAKDKTRNTLETILRSELALNTPAGIKIIDNASRFVVLKEEIDDLADDLGEFKITVHGALKLFGFKEEDVIKAFNFKVVEEVELDNPQEINVQMALRDKDITYGEPRIDFERKDMSVVVKFKSVWTREFDSNAFKTAVLGKRESEIADSTKSFPGIESATVSLWPFWVGKVPSNPDKVSIDVE